MPNDLNLRHAQRVGAALTVVGAGAAAAAPLQPALLLVAALAVGAVVALNGGFFGFLRQRRGLVFAARCIPLHLVHHACGVAGYAAAWLTLRRPGQRRRGSPPVDSRPGIA
jgi:hypothetical protein